MPLLDHFHPPLDPRHELAAELTQPEVASLLKPGVEYHIESQYDAPEAAKSLQQLLESERTS